MLDNQGHRLNLTLDAERAAKLAALSEQTHLQEGTLARSLLSRALDEASPDPADIVQLLDSIPGGWERVDLGLKQASQGKTVPLEEL